MLTASQWNRVRATEAALVIVSTNAGQNIINPVRRVMPNATAKTISNPQGMRMTVRPALIENPLLTLSNPHSSSATIDNAIRIASGGIRLVKGGRNWTDPRYVECTRYVPMGVTFGDCVRQREALKASE